MSSGVFANVMFQKSLKSESTKEICLFVFRLLQCSVWLLMLLVYAANIVFSNVWFLTVGTLQMPIMNTDLAFYRFHNDRHASFDINKKKSVIDKTS